MAFLLLSLYLVVSSFFIPFLPMPFPNEDYIDPTIIRSIDEWDQPLGIGVDPSSLETPSNRCYICSL